MGKASILSIPAELLTDIFIEAAAEEPEASCLSRQLVKNHEIPKPAHWHRSHMNIILSHVSRTFRAAAIDTPQLWANVSNVQGKDELATFLRRTKEVGLGIHLLIDDPKEMGNTAAVIETIVVPREFLDVVIPLAHRWVGFEFQAGKWMGGFAQSGVATELTKMCHGLRLPSLRAMSLWYPCRPLWGDIFESKDFGFYETWRTPNLKHFSSTWHIPKATLDIISLNSLSLNIGTVPSPYYVPWDEEPLYTFIPLFNSLRRLSLRVGRSHFARLEPKWARIELPSLEVFVVHMDDMDVFNDDVRRFVMPSVKSMQIASRPVYIIPEVAGEIVTIRSWLSKLFHEENTFRKLESLHLMFLTARDWHRTSEAYECIDHASFPDVMDAVFSQFQSLRHLQLEGPFQWLDGKHKALTGTIVDSLANTVMPPVQTLTFRNCPNLMTYEVAGMLGAMKRSSNWLHFKKLNVHWCTSMDRPSLEKAVSEDQLCWVNERPVDDEAARVEAEDRAENVVFVDSDEVSSAGDLSDFDDAFNW